jgi:hypothetical protein
MRLVLAFVLACGGCCAYAAQSAEAAAAKPVNTICPMSGKAVDGSTTVTLKGTDGTEVLVATCCDGCAAKAQKKADKAIAAAQANKKLE